MEAKPVAEKHYKRTDKPKKSKVDVLYICRPQVERWSIEELEKHASTLEVARQELEKRKGVKDENNIARGNRPASNFRISKTK